MKLTKYSIFILIFLSTHVFTSCGSDDDGDITGTYTLTEITSSGCDNSSDNDSIDLTGDGCQIFGGEELCVKGTMTLTETNVSFSFDVSSRGDTETISNTATYTIDGNSITICDSNGCASSSINKSGKELTIKFPADFDGCALSLKGKK